MQTTNNHIVQYRVYYIMDHAAHTLKNKKRILNGHFDLDISLGIEQHHQFST